MLVWSSALSIPAVVSDSDQKVCPFFYESPDKVRKDDLITNRGAESDIFKAVERVLSSGSNVSDGMGHLVNEEKYFFIGSVFTEWNKMFFIVTGYG